MLLIRVILSRAEIDLIEIRNQYRELYRVTLERDISGDTSGSFKRLLHKIIDFSSMPNV